MTDKINYKKELETSLKKFFLKLLKKQAYITTIMSMHSEYKKKSIDFMARSLLKELNPYVSILMSDNYDEIFDKKIFDGKISLEHMKDEKEYTIRQLRMFYLYATGTINKDKAKRILINKPELFEKHKKEVAVIPSDSLPPVFGGFLGDLSKDIIPQLSGLDLSQFDMTNPMSILQNADIQKIIKNTSDKLQVKVDSGEINKEDLKNDMDKLVPENFKDIISQIGNIN